MWCVKFNKVLKHYSDIFDYTDTMASLSCYRIVGSTSMRQISDSIASQRWSVGLRSSDCGGYLITVHSLSCLRWFQLCEMEAAITSWANGGYKGQQHCSGRVWFLSNAQLVVFYSVLFITPKPQLWYNPLWWSIWRQSEGKQIETAHRTGLREDQPFAMTGWGVRRKKEESQSLILTND